MKIIIWGTGKTAKMILDNGINGEIVGFVQSKPDPEKSTFMGKPVYTPDNISIEYDIIYVASKFVDEIYGELRKSNIALNKVCFMNLPKLCAVNENDNWKMAESFLSGDNLGMVEICCGQKGFILQDLEKYNALNKRESFKYNEAQKYFIGEDKYRQAGDLGVYFFQDIWAAKLIYENAPQRHYDIGSRVDGFIAHLLSFRSNITLIDIRPLDIPLLGVDFIQADATNLDTIEDNSIESLSALHSLEHFGLGRYSDPVDPEACFKAFKAIQRKVMPEGDAYISVPVGKEHLEFNAHRVFYARTILEEFDEMELIEYSVAGSKGIEYNVPIDRYDSYNGAGFAGLFHFKKKHLISVCEE